jgi:hypothetical protein
MITFKDFILENKQILTLYHGSDISANEEFSKLKHELFLSTEIEFSKKYGKYSYQVTINPKKIFNSTSDEHRKETMDYIKRKIRERSKIKTDAEQDFYETVYLEMLNSHSTWHWVETIFHSPYMGKEYFNKRLYDALLITEEKGYSSYTPRVINYMIWDEDIILDFKLIGTTKKIDNAVIFVPLEKTDNWGEE